MKHNYFFSFTILILFTRAYDVYSTFQFTPDFSKEANPLSSILGLGGIGVTIVVSIIMLYTIFALYKYQKYKNDLLPKEEKLTYKEFNKYYNNFGKQGVRMLVDGYVFSRTFAVVGIITTIMWALINHTTWYYNNYHNPKLIYLMLIVVTIFFNFFFIKSKFKEYQRRQ